MRGMKVYRGRRVNPKEGYVSEVEVIVLEQSGDEKFLPIGLLKHRVRHSPTGFSWGYPGSGPADLARSILWDFIGAEPTPGLYQDFKFQFVSVWGDEWEIRGCQIQDWLDRKRGIKI